MKTFARVTMAGLLLVLAGCKDDPESQGQLQIAITDAAGDFYTYAIDVTSVALKRARHVALLPYAPQHLRP